MLKGIKDGNFLPKGTMAQEPASKLAYTPGPAHGEL